MTCRFQLPDPPASERTPLVEALLGLSEQLIEENRQQAETIQQLRDEIAVLKGEKGKPRFKASGMEEATNPNGENEQPGNRDEGTDEPRKRPGSAKRSKKAELTIHQEVCIAPAEPLPMGARFKGYQDVVIQDLRIESFNTRYRLEVWETSEGRYLRGALPDHLRDSRFGSELRRFVLYQHHHCQVTQPLLHEQLREWDVDISVGQIDALLSQHNEAFFAEKDQILVTGLTVSRSITVDDSGARHKGKNGYVTQIGNDHFAWFASTHSKSRIHFLELLHAGRIRYDRNAHVLDYWVEQGLPQGPRQALQASWPGTIGDPECWEVHLDRQGIFDERHRRIATEGALLGGLIEKGFSLELVIVSDGAGQFAILLHALCWVHGERLVHKLIPLNDRHREEQERVRGEIWDLYRDLKRYQAEPDPAQVPLLEARFDKIFTQRTSFQTLNRTLKWLHDRKDKLLLVLKRPEIPLHTNGSENDLRGYVKWRKVSGGTRSDLGRQCRDTFASLKKTCRKLGISYWDYLADRIESKGMIPPLPDIIGQRAMAAP
jgi:Transposase IS66 family